MSFDVAGTVRYSQVILKTGVLKFESNSQLVLAPNQEKGGIPTTLTIIADTIQIVDHAEITYDLDGRPGLDPETPAPPQMGAAANGFDGFSVPGEGSYPQASNGGDGGPGMTGQAGIAGIEAPELQIFAGTIKQSFPDAITVDFKGQDGGRGGDGGKGGKGGDGQKGAASQASDSWDDGDSCDREPGKGGNGGKGGDAGYPGRGGKGGSGGIVKVFVLQPSLASVKTWNYIVDGGKGAPSGNPGSEGGGGKGGPQGDQNDPCPARAEYAGSDGPSGQSMNQADPNWMTDYAGKDGAKGDAEWFVLSKVPH
jgi:hypothetical protein